MYRKEEEERERQRVLGALESSGVMIGGGWEKEQRGKGREGVWAAIVMVTSWW